MNDIEQLQQLIKLAQQHAWYPLAATVCMLLVEAQKIRRLDFLWSRLPTGYQWVVPLATAVALGFAKGFTEGKGFVGALCEAAETAAVCGPLSSGYDAWLTNSPLPWGGGAGGRKGPPPSLKPTLTPPPPPKQYMGSVD